MIDLHSHIMPNIDDGSSSMEDTLKILEEAKQSGFSTIILTSHYVENYYEHDEEERRNILNDIRSKIDGIELILGSEIYFSENILKLLKEKKASTINNSRYILFEFPMNNQALNSKEIVNKLIENNYIPIIAHPERYLYVQENIEFVEELAEIGALFQANYGSIIGMYGNKAKKTLKLLLKKDLITFFGSDVHRPDQIYPQMPKIVKKLKRIISEERFEDLSEDNLKKVLRNEKIDI